MQLCSYWSLVYEEQAILGTLEGKIIHTICATQRIEDHRNRRSTNTRTREAKQP